jgi:hypothetical protein
VATPTIWKEITTAFEGRMTGGSYAVENGIVRVRTLLGERAAELESCECAIHGAIAHVLVITKNI